MQAYIRFTVGMLALLGAIGSIENSPPLAFMFMGVLLWCVRAGRRNKVQYVKLKGTVIDENYKSIAKEKRRLQERGQVV